MTIIVTASDTCYKLGILSSISGNIEAMGNCHRKDANGQGKARVTKAAKCPLMSTETQVKTREEKYESAAINVEEGINHLPFKYHPEGKKAVKAYRCVQIRPILA